MRSRTSGAVLLILLASVALVACGGGNDQSTATNKTTTTAPPTTTTIPTTGTTVAGTTTPPPPAGCTTVGSTAEVRVDYPNLMTSLIGKDVRIGTHPCMERFVIELQPTDLPNPNFPGYWVHYASGPITDSPRGQPVTVRGTATLLVSMGAPMLRTDGTGYTGPRDVVPSNPNVILEYRLIEDFEGQSTWALGIDTTRNFKVSVLDRPARLVVDIQT
jgi:hypothetical protein